MRIFGIVEPHSIYAEAGEIGLLLSSIQSPLQVYFSRALVLHSSQRRWIWGFILHSAEGLQMIYT